MKKFFTNLFYAILALLVVGGAVLGIQAAIGNRSVAQQAPPSAPPPLPLPPGAAGPYVFSSDQVDWMPNLWCKTNSVSVPIDWITAEGIHITNGMKHNVTQYQLGMRNDGIVVWRKVGP